MSAIRAIRPARLTALRAPVLESAARSTALYPTRVATEYCALRSLEGVLPPSTARSLERVQAASTALSELVHLWECIFGPEESWGIECPLTPTGRDSTPLTGQMFTRNYAPDVRPEGTTGSSKGFRDRENAEEGQYIRRREQERLKEAKEKLEKAQAEYDAAHKEAHPPAKQ